MNDFGTLLKSKNLKYEEKWCPSTVDKFEKILLSNILSSKNSGVISNICYNLQYLQYICFQIEQLNLHNILSCNPKIYKYLNKYRDSRNNVHLQNAITKHKSDFWQYQKGDYYVVKYMLYKILTDVNLFMVDKNAECIKFLKLTKEEQIYTANYFKTIEKNEL